MFERNNVVIFVRVQQGCNLNCTHCFTLGNQDRVLTTPYAYVDRFLSAISRNVQPHQGTIYLHGGETFLAKMSYLRQVVARIRELYPSPNFKIIPQTNLVFKLTDEFMDFVLNHCDGHLGVSWDYKIRFGSIRSEHEQRQEALFFTNLRKLIDAGVGVNMSITAQRHLLELDPLKLVAMFEGVKSIDFELLTTFDAKTHDLKPNLAKWSAWLDRLVEHYQHNEVSWCLPQIDLITQAIERGVIYNCKCNCCDRRTFTLNPDGTTGFCPDNSYTHPVSHVDEMDANWPGFAAKAHEAFIARLASLSTENCYSCEHYAQCGGNCEDMFFDDSGECPLSKKVFSRIKQNKDRFAQLLHTRAAANLIEMDKQK